MTTLHTNILSNAINYNQLSKSNQVNSSTTIAASSTTTNTITTTNTTTNTITASSITLDKENSSLSSNIFVNGPTTSSISTSGSTASSSLPHSNQICYKDIRKNDMYKYMLRMKPNANNIHHSTHLPSSSALSSYNHAKYIDEIDAIRYINAQKVKKSLTFETNNSLATEQAQQQCDQHHHLIHNINKDHEYHVIEPKPMPMIEKEKNKDKEKEKDKDKENDKQYHENKHCNAIDDTIENKKSPVLDFKSEQVKIIEPYFGSIIESLKLKNNEFTPNYFLKKHKIPTNLRAKMVDWMVEVLSSYKCSDQTFFMAVNFMDLYFQKTPQILEVSDLHLIGVTSMFMASKYEEIYPLRLSIVYEKIAHKKLSIESIKKKENDILQVLEYKLTGVTPYELMMTTLYQMNLKENKMNDKTFDYLQKVCIYLAKMTMHDYDIINIQQYTELSASILFVAFKIIEQLDHTFPFNKRFKQMICLLNVNEEVVYECGTKILSMAKNFEKLYPRLDNLKKFHSFNIDTYHHQSAI